VTIDSYHSDNGIFKANDFVEELQDRNPQRIDYSGVGAHHQTASQKAPSTSLATALGP